jgi:rare lipoprotein A
MKLKIPVLTILIIGGLISPLKSSCQLLAENEGSGRILYGIASYYGKGFHGKQTANGEIFDQNAMTAACNVLPLGTWVKVTNLNNDRQVIVKVNDRLHYRMRRIADMSQGAAEKLGFLHAGLTRVKIEVLHNYKP